MPRLVAFTLLIGLAGPAAAQRIPDEVPDRTETIGERTERVLENRHRAFLSRLYLEATLASGPVLGEPQTLGAAVLEGGYRFANGDAVTVGTALQTPLLVEAGEDAAFTAASGTVGGQYVVGLGRLAPSVGLAKHVEVGLGAGVVYFNANTNGLGVDSRWTAEVSPRIVIPVTAFLDVPVGLRISRALDGPEAGATFVGLSLSARRHYATRARRVLE